MRWYWRWPPCTPAPPRAPRPGTRWPTGASRCAPRTPAPTCRAAARPASLAKAEPFRMKAATLGKYLLYGTKGDYLTPRGRRTPSPAGRRCGRSTRRCARGTAGSRSCAPACARASPRPPPAPRARRSRAPPGWARSRGTLDAHGHLTAYEFIGGKFHCGKPWSPLGIQDALPDCSRDRGPGGAGAPLQNLLDFGSPVSDKDQVGYPTFKDWPSTHALTYEGTYWKWVERSWRSGLRMMVTLLVDNDVLCNLQSKPRELLRRDGGREAPAQAPVRAAGLHRRPVRRARQGLPAHRHRPVPGPARGGRRQAGRGHGHGDLGAVRLPRLGPGTRVRPGQGGPRPGRVPQARRPLVLPRAQVRQPAGRHQDGRRHHRPGGQPRQQARLRQVLGRPDLHRARDRQHAAHQRRPPGRRPGQLRGRHAAGRRAQRPDAGLSARARTATRAG